MDEKIRLMSEKVWEDLLDYALELNRSKDSWDSDTDLSNLRRDVLVLVEKIGTKLREKWEDNE